MIKLFSLLLLVGLGLWPMPLVQAQESIAPLKLFWHAGRGDYFSTATVEGERSALEAGYEFIGLQGYVYRTPRAGTVPLKLFWSPGREDNFSTATIEGERSALNLPKSERYGFARIEGYVYPSSRLGTVPLKLFWREDRGDNYSTVTPDDERLARDSSYGYARIEGYVLPVQPRIITMRGSMHIVDYDWPDSDDFGEFIINETVELYHHHRPHAIERCVDDEVRVVLSFDLQRRADSTIVDVAGGVAMFEGASCKTSDLEDSRPFSVALADRTPWLLHASLGGPAYESEATIDITVRNGS